MSAGIQKKQRIQYSFILPSKNFSTYITHKFLKVLKPAFQMSPCPIFIQLRFALFPFTSFLAWCNSALLTFLYTRTASGADFLSHGEKAHFLSLALQLHFPKLHILLFPLHFLQRKKEILTIPHFTITHLLFPTFSSKTIYPLQLSLPPPQSPRTLRPLQTVLHSLLCSVWWNCSYSSSCPHWSIHPTTTTPTPPHTKISTWTLQNFASWQHLDWQTHSNIILTAGTITTTPPRPRCSTTSAINTPPTRSIRLKSWYSS